MEPKHLIRAAQGVYLSVAIGMFGYLGTTHIAFQSHAKRVQAYVEQHADGWFTEQVRHAGLEHLNPAMPNIRYKLPHTMDSHSIGGRYDKRTNTIELNAAGLWYLQMPRTGFSFDHAGKYIMANPRARVEDVFRHEVGHYFTDVIATRIGYADWMPELDAEIARQWNDQNTVFIFGGDYNPVRQAYLDFLKEHENTLTDIYLHNIVNEGIAEYFQSQGTKVGVFTDLDWPAGITDLDRMHTVDLNYAGGYHLVRPIIQEHGVRGIEYLIANPPRALDFRDLPHYQTEALEALCR